MVWGGRECRRMACVTLTWRQELLACSRALCVDPCALLPLLAVRVCPVLLSDNVPHSALEGQSSTQIFMPGGPLRIPAGAASQHLTPHTHGRAVRPRLPLQPKSPPLPAQTRRVTSNYVSRRVVPESSELFPPIVTWTILGPEKGCLCQERQEFRLPEHRKNRQWEP